jgi:long-chain acyl-CoA synthetase
LHGGEPCPTPLKAAIADWFGEILVEYYGFTEGGITTIGADEWRNRPGSVGRPIAALEIQILGDDGERLPPNAEGTVHFASAAKPNYFVYQGDQDKTDRAFTGNAFTVGDVGYVDDDGYLYLCGRLADIVVSAGVNVYPAEIEQALTDVPGIADLCAVGAPDPERGEAVVLHAAARCRP